MSPESTPILQAAQDNPQIRNQFTIASPLPLTFSPDDDDYVVPLNNTIADKLLSLASREKSELLLEVFVALAKAVAPYVNRYSGIRGTAEARLAGRLFSAEKVAGPLLGEGNAEKFFEASKAAWEWNSRYWEQRALLVQASDLDGAIQYARHAVAIEAHPFPWTTLASILIRKLDATPGMRDELFNEAYDLLYMTLRREEVRDWRPTPHPYATLFHATSTFLKFGGFLTSKHVIFIREQISKVQIHFQRDIKLQRSCEELSRQIV